MQVHSLEVFAKPSLLTEPHRRVIRVKHLLLAHRKGSSFSREEMEPRSYSILDIHRVDIHMQARATQKRGEEGKETGPPHPSYAGEGIIFNDSPQETCVNTVLPRPPAKRKEEETCMSEVK